MYNFLCSINQLSTKAKVIILVGLILLFGPMLAIIFAIFIRKARETDPTTYQAEINTFKSNYDKLRQYVDGTENNLIYVGSYVCEYEGQTFYGSKFISIYAKNISSAITGAYPFIEQRTIEGDTYYQFPIKEKYSKTAKITIILATLRYVAETYSDDELHDDRSIPLGIAAVGKLKSMSGDGIRNSFTK